MSNQLLRGRGSEAKRRGRGGRWVLNALLRLEVVPARIGLLLLFGLPRRWPVAPSLSLLPQTTQKPTAYHDTRGQQCVQLRYVTRDVSQNLPKPKGVCHIMCNCAFAVSKRKRHNKFWMEYIHSRCTEWTPSPLDKQKEESHNYFSLHRWNSSNN